MSRALTEADEEWGRGGGVMVCHLAFHLYKNSISG